MSENKAQHPVVAVAKAELGEGIRVLSTGVRAHIRPVAATLIDEVTARIPDPDIPTWHNPDKDRDEPNPNDPTYQRELRAATRRRGLAAMDAMIMFGVELADGMPEDESWLARLRLMHKHNLVDLDGYDLDDPLEREFLYKRYIAVGAADLVAIGRMTGVSEEGIAAAAANFPGDAGRGAD